MVKSKDDIDELKHSDIIVTEDGIDLLVLMTNLSTLTKERRDDFNYYEPIEELEEYPDDMLYELKDVLEFPTEQRNPSNDSRANFKYIEIGLIDIQNGEISDYTELPCDEDFVPSRARKVVHKNDIIISSVRPTRGAIAIVSDSFENEICSTGFLVVRPKIEIDLNYLHYILRSNLVMKQFKKFQSGSSYPAIIKEHVKKTIIPIPELQIQTNIGNMWMKIVNKIRIIRKEIDDEIDSLSKEANKIIMKAKPVLIKKEQSELTDYFNEK